VLSVEAVEAPDVVTSAWIDEQLADVFLRCDVAPGCSRARRDQAAALVARVDALRRCGRARRRAGDRRCGIDRSEIGMLISTSVCKHHLDRVRLRRAPPPRPRAGLPQLDLGNACLGFVNAIHLARNRDRRQARFLP